MARGRAREALPSAYLLEVRSRYNMFGNLLLRRVAVRTKEHAQMHVAAAAVSGRLQSWAASETDENTRKTLKPREKAARSGPRGTQRQKSTCKRFE